MASSNNDLQLRLWKFALRMSTSKSETVVLSWTRVKCQLQVRATFKYLWGHLGGRERASTPFYLSCVSVAYDKEAVVESHSATKRGATKLWSGKTKNNQHLLHWGIHDPNTTGPEESQDTPE